MEPTQLSLDEEILSQNSRDMLDLTADLNEYLPPWSKASSSERKQIVVLALGIYFPVAFTFTVIFGITFLFIGYYIYPILSAQDDDPAVWYWHSNSEKKAAQIRAWVFLGLYIWFLLNMLVSFYRVSTTDPGRVPKKKPWLITGEELGFNAKHNGAKSLLERRKDGFVRQCLKCYRRKPDRCHHCRLCERCVLKMDHHCPWVANCIGYHNYKYFLILVFYSALGLLLFTGTFWETVVIVIYNESISAGFCLFILSAYTLASILTVALTVFFIFHVWLNFKDYTTIEFCEKRSSNGELTPSVFRVSFYSTLKENLGRNPLLWFVPTSYRTPDDTGLTFHHVIAPTKDESRP